MGSYEGDKVERGGRLENADIFADTVPGQVSTLILFIFSFSLWKFFQKIYAIPLLLGVGSAKFGDILEGFIFLFLFCQQLKNTEDDGHGCEALLAIDDIVDVRIRFLRKNDGPHEVIAF